VVIVNGMTYGPFQYGVGGSFIIPANNTNPTATFRDADISDCSASRPVGVLTTCSDLCVISMTLDGTQCDDNGTESDATDDIFTYSVTVTGLNTANSWYVQGNPGNTYPYNQSITLGPRAISAGSFTLIVVDSDDPNCTASVTITPPDPCSTNCDLTITQLSKLCNDNGTPSDPSDDFYTVSVNATAVNPGQNNTFVVIINGNTFGPYNYGTGGSFSIPADGSNPMVVFRDSDIPGMQRESAAWGIDNLL
jgi:hypothetical protein